MKKLILALAMVLSVGTASAFEYQLTPTTLAPAVAAKKGAAVLGTYVIAAEGLSQGSTQRKFTGFDAAALDRVVTGGMTICYGPTTSVTYSAEKPLAPFACVEDAMSLSNSTKSFGRARVYNSNLTPPLTEVTFKAKLESIVE